MQEQTDIALCCVLHCPNSATHVVEGTLGQWIVAAHFCREHERELSVGTPMGGVGIDACRLQVRPQDSALPSTGTTRAIGPQ